MILFYYIGLDYEFFMNEGNGNDIIKYVGVQKMLFIKFF